MCVKLTMTQSVVLSGIAGQGMVMNWKMTHAAGGCALCHHIVVATAEDV